MKKKNKQTHTSARKHEASRPIPIHLAVRNGPSMCGAVQGEMLPAQTRCGLAEDPAWGAGHHPEDWLRHPRRWDLGAVTASSRMVVKIDEVIFNNSRCQLHRTLQMLIITTVISLEDKIKIVANTPKALGTG